MRKTWMFGLMLMVAAAFGSLGLLSTAVAHEGHDHEASEQGEMAKAAKYVCPMHPEVQSDEPGECPKCGMTLKQVDAQEGSDEDSKEENVPHDHKHHQ